MAAISREINTVLLIFCKNAAPKTTISRMGPVEQFLVYSLHDV
jgi:hypothetical protein